jgi:hypothetical protein
LIAAARGAVALGVVTVTATFPVGFFASATTGFAFAPARFFSSDAAGFAAALGTFPGQLTTQLSSWSSGTWLSQAPTRPRTEMPAA